MPDGRRPPNAPTIVGPIKSAFLKSPGTLQHARIQRAAPFILSYFPRPPECTASLFCLAAGLVVGEGRGRVAAPVLGFLVPRAQRNRAVAVRVQVPSERTGTIRKAPQVLSE